MITLETERLVLRNYRASDLPEYHAILSDAANMRFLYDIITRTMDESRASLEDALRVNAEGRARRFAITLRGDDRVIGAVGYEIAAVTPAGKIADPMGWFLSPAHHGKGYMTEAVRRVLAYAFDEDDCARVVTACFRENVPSHKVMIKAGFRQEAEKLKAMWLEDGLKDRLEFAINKDEWRPLCWK